MATQPPTDPDRIDPQTPDESPPQELPGEDPIETPPETEPLGPDVIEPSRSPDEV